MRWRGGGRPPRRPSPGAGFRRLVCLINTNTQALRSPAPDLAGQPWKLHPVLAAPTAADRRVAEARRDAASTSVTVPARTVGVWVVEE
ncbi:MAG: alpha-1,6-glucosidase domain-containing protein [Rubrivivax sp.]